MPNTGFPYQCIVRRKGEEKMEMPNDPFILMSYLNTQLRDHYDSFAELCKRVGADAAEIEEKMKTIGYYYCAEQNQFRPGK